MRIATPVLSRLQVDGEEQENDVEDVPMGGATTAVDDDGAEVTTTGLADTERIAEDFLDEDEMAAWEAGEEDA